MAQALKVPKFDEEKKSILLWFIWLLLTLFAFIRSTELGLAMAIVLLIWTLGWGSNKISHLGRSHKDRNREL